MFIHIIFIHINHTLIKFQTFCERIGPYLYQLFKFQLNDNYYICYNLYYFYSLGNIHHFHLFEIARFHSDIEFAFLSRFGKHFHCVVDSHFDYFVNLLIYIIFIFLLKFKYISNNNKKILIIKTLL